MMEKLREEIHIHNRWCYELTTVLIDAEEDVRYTTYGVQVLDSAGNVAAAFADVSTDKLLVESIVEKCNEYDLSLIHLHDVLLDFLL